MQQKKIILFSIILFIAASAWLSFASHNFIDPNVGKNWWALSFADPSAQNLDFTIANHSNQSKFHWEVLKNNQKLKEGNMTIQKGANQNVTLEENFTGGKFIINVTTEQEKREIYKNL